MNEIKSVSGELTREFTDQTKTITSELKAARESAKVEIDTPDLNIKMDQLESDRIKALKQKNSQNIKPTVDGDVTYDNNNTVAKESDNNQQSLNVNPQKDQ